MRAREDDVSAATTREFLQAASQWEQIEYLLAITRDAAEKYELYQSSPGLSA